jgi:multiple sugar transport system permease protein
MALPWWSQLITPKRLLPYLLLAPAIIALLVFVVVPVGFSLYLSLTNAELLRFDQREVIGLGNYERLLARNVFWESLYNTLVYTAGSVVLSFGMGLFTALLLNENFRFRGIARTMISIPWAVPWLVTTTIWYVMFNPQMGPINEVLKDLGLIQTGVPWLYQNRTAMIAIIIVTAWRIFPTATLLILAGLQSIVPDLYEAAKVDGANTWQRFRYITLPSLRSVNLVVIVLLTITAFKLFTVAWTLTQGGPGTATTVLSVYTYQEAFMSNRLGRASALATLSVLVSSVLVIVYFLLIGREDRKAEAT